MVRSITKKVRPTKGFAHIFHLSFVAIVPLVAFLLVRIELGFVALAVILLSKWRMFAVKPHHWMLNIRTNAVDIVVGLSWLVLVSSTTAISWQIFWVLIYEFWLVVIRPGTSLRTVSLQALIAQGMGMTSVFLYFEDSPLGLYVVLFWAIAYFGARHFLASFDEPYAQIIASQWAFFTGALAWVLGHWLLFASVVAMPALLATLIGLGLGLLYYLEETDKLTSIIRKQIIIMTILLTTLIIALSNWGDRVI